jgi:arsenate reductase
LNIEHSQGGNTPRVLFVCTHNSARSLMAEALMRKHVGSAFEVFSAGTNAGQVNPMTLRVLEESGLPTRDLRSKSVAEFNGQRFDYVITVCDQAREACPVFPGSGSSLHWSFPDPSEATGSDDERLTAFREVFQQIEMEIAKFASVATRADSDKDVARV